MHGRPKCTAASRGLLCVRCVRQQIPGSLSNAFLCDGCRCPKVTGIETPVPQLWKYDAFSACIMSSPSCCIHFCYW